MPDRSRYLDFEPHRVLDVYAHFPGGQDKVPVRPLYSAPMDESGGAVDRLCSTRCGACRAAAPSRRRRYGAASDYTGTDMFISLVEPAGIEDERQRSSELSVRALCSNRHLTEHLPVGEGGADFRLLDDVDARRRSASRARRRRAGRWSAQMRSRSETAHTGTVTWRLINMLSLNHLGLVERGAGQERGSRCSEMLSLFADLPDSATERKIRGIAQRRQPAGGAARCAAHRQRRRRAAPKSRSRSTRRRSKAAARSCSARSSIASSAEYSALNHFTQTVIRTTERGEIMRWPARMGSRRPL